MVTMTFKTLAGGALVIDCQVVYGTVFDDERYNQFSARMGDGTLRTYDTGRNIVKGIIIMKAVSLVQGELLRTWIRADAIFQLNTFTITPSHSSIDIGNGDGVAVTGANFIGLSTEGVFEKLSPGIYKLNFPFSFVRS